MDRCNMLGKAVAPGVTALLPQGVAAADRASSHLLWLDDDRIRRMLGEWHD